MDSPATCVDDVALFIESIRVRPVLWRNHREKEKAWTEIGEIIYDHWPRMESTERSEKMKEMRRKWRIIRDKFGAKRNKYIHAKALSFLPEGGNGEYLATNVGKKPPKKESSEQKKKDSDKSYLLSLLPTFRQLNDDEKKELKLLIQFVRKVRQKKSQQQSAPVEPSLVENEPVGVPSPASPSAPVPFGVATPPKMPSVWAPVNTSPFPAEPASPLKIPSPASLSPSPVSEGIIWTFASDSGTHSKMFTADILNMAGGKESDVDVRKPLSVCAETMSANPASLHLYASPPLPRCENQRIALMPGGHHFSAGEMKQNPLAQQLGHSNVKDAAANNTNILYAGSNVVEYDLVKRDTDGKRYIYSSVLAGKGRYRMEAALPETGNRLLDSLLESSLHKIKSLIELEGPHIGSGKLLMDIMLLMRLYEEETRRAESACVDPAFRKILARCYGDEEEEPLFKVAFVTNAALMGLKVVFYPTALEWQNRAEKDCSKLKRLLKIQLSLLGQCMPAIVKKIERAKTDVCFELDIGGSSNWNLPGHCKNDPLSFPYHFAQLVGQDKNVLEISNTKMVTSLGVVDCAHAREWMCGYLDEFERRSTYAENLLGVFAASSNASEWRRKVLFSDIGPELPFRNKSITMDLDFCLSGMCYHYVASGQGISLSKKQRRRRRDKKMFSDERVQDKDETPPVPPVPANIPTAAYDNTISDPEQMSRILNVCDKFGMFLGQKNVAPGLSMRILSASTQVAKVKCMESLSADKVTDLKWLSRLDKLNHKTLMEYALLQLILRYECRRMVLQRDRALLCSSLKSWSSLDFNAVWKFAHEETLNPPTEESLAAEDGHGPTAQEERPDASFIKNLLTATASTFATGADNEDTLFSWLMVTLAERFCALYNIVSHPEEYYESQRGRLSFEGGLATFKKMCEILLPELEVYLPKNAFKVCRKAARDYEIGVVKSKNATNSKVCRVKLAELKMIHGLDEKTKAINHNQVSTTTADVGCKTLEAFYSLFDPLKASGDENADVVSDFFNCVNDNMSFDFRATLCHRQKYVSLEVVRALEKELGRLLTLQKSTNLTKEIRERSKRMRDWIVPFTMPSNDIRDCCCHAGCIKLLVIPPSAHLKSLTIALKFNTMAAERRYFGDVSAALGFVARRDDDDDAAEHGRWKSFLKYKCNGEFLAPVSTGGLYENVILADDETIAAFRSRTAARKRGQKTTTSNKHTGFFSGVWALCADHDLETTVLGSTVTCPFSPTPLLKMSSRETADTDARIRLAQDARTFFEREPSLGFFESFEQMIECMRRTNLRTGCGGDDAAFFSGLIKRHRHSEIPGAKMWILFSTVSECFRNSLPVDWSSLITDWSSQVLNLTAGANNVDESGAVFETCRFVSVCARSFFGACLNVPLDTHVWERLLDEPSWVGELARAYEAAMQDSDDVRVIENFINSSKFMTNNNMMDKLNIVPTTNESALRSVWKDRGEGEPSLRKRAEWMTATEKGMSISFSFVLAAISLFRILSEEDVKKLAQPQVSLALPLIRGLKVTSGWCKTFTQKMDAADVSKCISEMRFADVRKDPLFFYRFAGYTIGLIAANDAVLENMTRPILESFDFNGFDTSNWTQFIRYHFPSILLGRRARLLSRPLAFIKNLVGLAASSPVDQRVRQIVSRLANLSLVKLVDSETVSLNDILDCCILEDDDVTVRSISALYNTVRTDDKPEYAYNLASNSCTNTQLAKIKSASRLLNCNVSSHDTSTVASSVDADEESIIDPSADSALSAADAQVARRPAGDGETRKTGDHRNPQQAASQSVGVLSYDEETLDVDTEPAELSTKSQDILKKVSNMLTQRDMNSNVVQLISKMKTFLTLKNPFHESDYQKLGVKLHVIKAGIEAIRRWDEAVQEQSSKIIDECEDLQGDAYDMDVIDPEDYARSRNKNCTYSATAEMFAPSFHKTLLDYGELGEEDNFHWLKLSKHDLYSGGGGRLAGEATKDMVQFTGEDGTAEIRVITDLYSNRVYDSYWTDVIPSRDDTSNKKRKVPPPPSNVVKLSVNAKAKEGKSINHCANLMSVYRVTDQTEGIEDDKCETTKSPDDVTVTLGHKKTDKHEQYKCLFSFWNCNNGISPRNQVELLKKLLFKNTNVLWIKQYDRHINVLNTWGCLNFKNAYDSHFSLCHYTHDDEVRDAVPPVSVFHSRFLDDAECDSLLKATAPLLALKKRSDDAAPSEPVLLSALYSREILSSCLDPEGKFCTSCITNSSSVLFTPGTKFELFLEDDEELAGNERELRSRNFLACTLEILHAIETGVFFDSRTAAEKRVLRPYSAAGKIGGDHENHSRKSIPVVFETPETNNVISETNDCVLLNCNKAKCLLMSQRAMLNSTAHSRYDGSVFDPSSMRHHAGISKGYLLDDRLDLFSHAGGGDISGVFAKCANHFILPNSDKNYRIFTTDWNVIKSVLLQFDAAAAPSLAKLSPYNLHAMNVSGIGGGGVKRCCFLANPCGPARRLLRRAPNMRICMTNAGVAQMSRRLAQSDRRRNVEDLIRDGSITTFRVTSGSSCISVDNSRYFLVDGTYLVGGRIEDVNLQTDMFTRCKLKAEKHVVYNSVFSSATVSAFLATAIEGTTHSQGLGLVEHVSSMKNNQDTELRNKNFWSLGVASTRRNAVAAQPPPRGGGGELKPPSVYTNDDDYVFLKMLYEIARAADNATTTTRAALYALRKCYVDCVDQTTGIPRLHAVYFLRSLLNFGGFCTAVCSGDGEKSHHLVYTLNSVALNMAAKVVVVLVGPTGNNLKTTIVELFKKAWFEKYADVSIGVLNSSRDSTSSTQANLAYYAGNRNILIIDEVGYQGSVAAERESEKDVSRDDAKAVWKQIDSAVTKSRLKICSKECDDVMAARLGVQKSRKRHNSGSSGVDNALTDSAWLITNGKVHVKSFANTVLWWNCTAGTVIHAFNDTQTCFNMFSENRYPFSVSDCRSSPWLQEANCRPEIGPLDVRCARHCLAGECASSGDEEIYGPLIAAASREEAHLGWKLELSLINNAIKAKVEKVFMDLVKGDLLRWTVMNSAKHADRRPVLTCVPDSEEFKTLLRTHDWSLKKALDEHRLNPEPYEFSKTGAPDGGGVLYAFHAVHSGSEPPPPPPPFESSMEVECADAEALGPVLRNVSFSAVRNHRAKSRKLSSVIFSGGDTLDYEVDEDNHRLINMAREYDYALFGVMQKPSSKGFPKITTDGALVMSTSTDDCRSVLARIKNTILDTGKVSNAGSFVRLCADKGLLDDEGQEEDDKTLLKPRLRTMVTSLIKFESDGTTAAAMDNIANAVSSKSDSGITKHMLPGQFNSNLLKKITSKQASAAMRGIYCKPVVSSISMTPIMTSNSYVFSFFVDEALAKRLLVFPCNTQFAFGSENENVETFVRLVDNGLKCVHSALTLERQDKWRRDGMPPSTKQAERAKATADSWLSAWNESAQRGMPDREHDASDLSSVAAALPAQALQLLVKNSAMEHRDVASMTKLEESTNTFMHLYTTFTLASRNTSLEEEKEEEEQRRRNVQICRVNPKSLNTTAMTISKSREEAWTKVHLAMNCVLFVEAPFVHTTRLFGEDCNLRMHVPRKEGVNPSIDIDWCIGMRMPNPDMDVNGYCEEGPMIGAGAAIMKHVCDAWGCMDLRNIMFSCHHLHMIFELVLQFHHPNKKLTSIENIGEKNKAGVDYVSVLFATLIYREIMAKTKYPVFGTARKNKRKTQDGVPFEIPMFLALVANKPLRNLRRSTNLSQLCTAGAEDHAKIIKFVTTQLGMTLNPDFLCGHCNKKYH